MGIWDFISGTAECIKGNSPDLTSVKSWCSYSYGYTASTVSSVKDNAGKLVGHYWPSQEAQSKIVPFAKTLALYSAQETLKFVPGAVPAYNVSKKSIRDVKKSENNDDYKNWMVDIKALNEKVMALEREMSKKVDRETETVRTELKKPEHLGSEKNSVSMDNNNNNNKPEDVIKEFMVKNFMGKMFLNDMLVPVTVRNKNNEELQK